MMNESPRAFLILPAETRCPVTQRPLVAACQTKETLTTEQSPVPRKEQLVSSSTRIPKYDAAREWRRNHAVRGDVSGLV